MQHKLISLKRSKPVHKLIPGTHVEYPGLGIGTFVGVTKKGLYEIIFPDLGKRFFRPSKPFTIISVPDPFQTVKVQSKKHDNGVLESLTNLMPEIKEQYAAHLDDALKKMNLTRDDWENLRPEQGKNIFQMKEYIENALETGSVKQEITAALRWLQVEPKLINLSLIEYQIDIPAVLKSVSLNKLNSNADLRSALERLVQPKTTLSDLMQNKHSSFQWKKKVTALTISFLINKGLRIDPRHLQKI
jgi:hypothetical protein